VKSLLVPQAWPQLLSACGYLLLFVLVMYRRIPDGRLRAWIAIVPVWVAFMFSYGILVETRVFRRTNPIDRVLDCADLGTVIDGRAYGIGTGLADGGATMLPAAAGGRCGRAETDCSGVMTNATQRCAGNRNCRRGQASVAQRRASG
jgi:hypothetical protein